MSDTNRNPPPLGARHIVAQVTGLQQGSRVYRDRAFLINPELTEPDFIPAHGETPSQSRVHHYVWVPRLRRWDVRPALVVSDSLGAVA